MRSFLTVGVLLLVIPFLLVSCGSAQLTVDPETFIIVDRQTGTVYYPDPEPKPEIRGETITFVQDNKAYMLTGNWLVVGELTNLEKLEK